MPGNVASVAQATAETRWVILSLWFSPGAVAPTRQTPYISAWIQRLLCSHDFLLQEVVGCTGLEPSRHHMFDTIV